MIFFYAKSRMARNKRSEANMTPNGKDLLATLIRLLEDQEGVKITYELEEGAA